MTHLDTRPWLDLRERLGAKLALRVELHVLLVIEALAKAAWWDSQIRDVLGSPKWRDPHDVSALEASQVLNFDPFELLRSLVAEVGIDTVSVAITCAVSDRGWPRTLAACEVRPRTVRVHRPPTNDLIDYR
jgi:hypothetical protein